MNMREGMRRVGIVLGALGCVAGGATGYWNLQNAWSLHTKFERLQDLPIMHDVNAAINRDLDSLAQRHGHIDFSNMGGIPAHCTEYLTYSVNPTTRADVDNFMKWESEKSRVAQQAPNSIMHGVVDDYIIEPGGQFWLRCDGCRYTIRPPDYETGFDVCAVTASNGASLVSNALQPADVNISVSKVRLKHPNITPEQIDKDFASYKSGGKMPDYFMDGIVEVPQEKPAGTLPPVIVGFKVDVDDIEDIHTVNVDKAGAISSIQLTSGEWVYSRKTLNFVASLLLPFCLPVIGFLVPWGTIKVLTWVGTGFIEPRGSA